MASPAHLKYTEEQEWVAIEDGVATIGITDHAQNELGEIVYVEIETVGETIEKGEIFGTVEAVKTTSELFMPLSCYVLEFNSALDESEDDNPGLINEDCYGEGWIIKIKITDDSQLEGLMDAEAYEALVG